MLEQCEGDKLKRIIIESTAKILKKLFKNQEIKELPFKPVKKEINKEQDVLVTSQLMGGLSNTLVFFCEMKDIEKIMEKMRIDLMPIKKTKKLWLTSIEFFNMVCGYSTGLLEDLYDLRVKFTPPIAIFKNDFIENHCRTFNVLNLPFEIDGTEINFYFTCLDGADKEGIYE